jgi:hypothetical protein
MSKDKPPLRAYKKGRVFFPFDQFCEDAFAAIKEGAMVELTIKQRRSLPQLQAYWSMLSRVVEATDAFPSAEHLHEALKMDLGYFRPMKLLSGEIVFVPDSVAFNKMTAPAFREYFAKAEKLIAEKFGIDPQELREAA